MINSNWMAILKTLCDLPTAPLREEHVLAWVEQYVATLSPAGQLSCTYDRAGNLRVDHIAGADSAVPAARHLVFESHADHPGFLTGQMINRGQGLLRAEFAGGVKPSFFAGAGVRLFHPDGRNPWCFAVIDRPPLRPADSDTLDCVLRLKHPGIDVSPGTIGMWDLPDAALTGDLFTARACDDLAGVAAMICMLHEVCRRRIYQSFTLLFTRGEEIGFLGAIAAIQAETLATAQKRKQCCIIGLEASRALPQAAMGLGPVVRVGDRTSIFHSALTRFVKLAADDLIDALPGFRYQRALMDGGTCNSTVFDAAGFEAAGLTLPLANYHNMLSDEHACSYAEMAPRTGDKIGSEAIGPDDFAHLVELMVHVVEKFSHYTGDHRGLQEQLEKRLTRYAEKLYAVAPHQRWEHK